MFFSSFLYKPGRNDESLWITRKTQFFVQKQMLEQQIFVHGSVCDPGTVWGWISGQEKNRGL
jgi:hypothetical protein